MSITLTRRADDIETLPASTDSAPETLPASTDSVPETLQTVLQDIELLDVNGKLSNKVVAEKVNELIERINALSKLPHANNSAHGRDRGPKSTRVMTEDDAKRIMLGDLVDMSHKDAAEELGLSYGQVYSARFGYTFKSVYKESDKRWATKK